MTTAQYNEHLARIERVNAKEPLLRLLRMGHTRLNETVYLPAALGRLPDEDLDPEPHQVTDETLRGLWRERTRLFSQMNKQSNAFHTCKSDAERAENSRKVLDWWEQIVKAKERITYYHEHGTLPPEEAEEPLPDNPVALGKLINSLRARISQTKKAMQELAQTDHPDKAERAAALEQKLKALRHQCGLAEQKLNTYA